MQSLYENLSIIFRDSFGFLIMARRCHKVDVNTRRSLCNYKIYMPEGYRGVSGSYMILSSGRGNTSITLIDLRVDIHFGVTKTAAAKGKRMSKLS